jgi:hypothetical protein
MKTSRCFLLTFAYVITLAVRVQGQGTFRNLNFEQASIIPLVGSPYYPYGIATSNALPGWTAYQAGSSVSAIVYDDLALGAAWVSLHTANDTFGSFYGGLIQGSYTVLLQPSFPGATDSAAIGQVGVIPTTAQSLRFYANGPLTVSFNSQQLSLIALGTGPNYTIYGGDVSAYAGATGELRFTASTISPSTWGSALDNIFFSGQPVPEPTTSALFAIAVVLFSGRFLKRHD